MMTSVGPLALGWPQKAAWMSLEDALLLLGVAATSFLGQLVLTRGFQLLEASKASSINFTQVSEVPSRGKPGRGGGRWERVQGAGF
jgi:drug/metabolite transporter (DMT)-like permease